MQKMTRKIIAGALVIALPIVAFACGDLVGIPPMQGGMPPPSHMMGGLPPPLAELVAELAKLRELDLSDAQQKKIFDVIYGQVPAIFENDRIAHNTMRDLHQIAMSDKFDAAKVKSLTGEHTKAMSILIYLRAETQAKVWAILTEPQRKRLLDRMGPALNQ